MSEKEKLELGKKEVIKQLSKRFPFYKYGITAGSVISDTDVVVGRPVKLKDRGDIGIIYDVKPVQKFPIKISLVNGQVMACTKQAIEKIPKRTKIDELVTGREEWERSLEEWMTGKTAFFVNKGEIIPVVINSRRNGK